MRGLLGTCWFRKFIQNLAGCRRDGAVTILNGAVWASGCQREWDWQPIPSRGLPSGCQSRLLACVALLRSPLDGLAIGSRGHLDGTVTILNDFQSGSTSVSHPAAKKKVPTFAVPVRASWGAQPRITDHEFRPTIVAGLGYTGESAQLHTGPLEDLYSPGNANARQCHHMFPRLY